jgi:DNA polymerase-3 subunit epsilon
MILRLSRPLVCFDIETTGLDVERDRIVEIGLVRLEPDGSRTRLQKRCDPGIDIPEAAARVHGIRNEDVRGLFGEPALHRIGAELCAFLGDSDLAGFNCIAFDLPLWLAECRRHRLPFGMGDRSVVDAKTLFDLKEPSWDRFLQGPRNLSNAVLHYLGRSQAAAFAKRDDDSDFVGIALDEQNRHSAAKDADATLDVLLAQLERHPELPRDVAGLHELCAQTSGAAQVGR